MVGWQQQLSWGRKGFRGGRLDEFALSWGWRVRGKWLRPMGTMSKSGTITWLLVTHLEELT